MTDPAPNPSAFSAAAEIAARPFASREEAITATLHVIHTALGLRTPFVTRIQDGILTVIASESYDGCLVNTGDTLDLDDAY